MTGWGAPEPAGQNTLAAPQGKALEELDARGQKYPASHCPHKAREDSPEEAPNLPAGQSSHALALARLYVPGGHWKAVAFVLPAGHAYPAVQLPEHTGDVWPGPTP